MRSPMRSTGLSRNAFFLFIASSAALGACNSITGINDLELEDDLGGGARGGTAGTGGTGGIPTLTTGSGGMTTNPTTGGGGDGGSSTNDALSEAGGVTITEIAVYQGVKTDLFKDGKPADDGIAIAAGRD